MTAGQVSLLSVRLCLCVCVRLRMWVCMCVLMHANVHVRMSLEEPFQVWRACGGEELKSSGVQRDSPKTK